MSIIAGINAFHADSSACLLKDGRLVAAVEEERFKRIKHWAGLPVDSLRYCLREAGAEFGDIEIIALNTDPRASLGKKVLYTLLARPDIKLLANRLRSRRARLSVPDALARIFGHSGFGGEVHEVEHHTAHLASSFLSSPFDDAALVSVDGFGDFTSTAWGIGTGNTMRILGRVHFPHSLGIFYETITHHLGFKRYGDEYKVMGLAPYGADRYREEMEHVVRLEPDGGFSLRLDCFRHHQGESVVQWEDCEPVADDYFTAALCALIGPPRGPGEPISQRHVDIACSTQALYERALNHLLRNLHTRSGSRKLVLSGGCAFNSVANGKIYSNTPFEKVYVQAAAGDAGGALGAALHAWNVRLAKPREFCMTHAYWGPGYSDEEIAERLRERHGEIVEAMCRLERLAPSELLGRVAAGLADGKVIGWFQGRMEWGPRALGNRSILADPRRRDMKEILNARIKRRESFRPFAPAVLRERVSEWFENDDDVPFMMKVFQVREQKRALIPAVTHVDGSSRLQTVGKDQNPGFHRLIEEFFELTGVPMVLNTSFNENEPIVRTPEEALDCFLRTNMDGLAIGNHLLMRSDWLSDARGVATTADSDLAKVDD